MTKTEEHPGAPWDATGDDGKIPVWRVEMPYWQAYISPSWDNACEFLKSECEPYSDETHDPASEGIRIILTLERWEPARISALGEWSP